MEINLAGRQRVPLAMLAAFAAMPLFAQPTLIEQGRAAINRCDSDAAIEILEKAVAQAPKSAEERRGALRFEGKVGSVML